MKKLIIACLLYISLLPAKSQTNLPTNWNFSNPGISTPPSGWTMGLGTNGNLTYAFGIGDALSARLDATNEFFMIQFNDKPGPLSYYLSPQNAGAAWGGQFDIQESNNGINWTTLRSVTYKATTVTNYTGARYVDIPSPSSRYIRFFYTSKLPGGVSGVPGGNMGVDSVWIQAPPPPPIPSINLKNGSISLVSGSTLLTGNSTNTALTVENKGTLQTLSVDSVKFVGDAAGDFSVNGMPLSISAGSSATLNIGFSPASSGTRKASMYVYCNDSVKSPFVLNLYGIGGNYASEPLSQPSNLVFSNVQTFAYEGRYSFVGSRPEHFLVLRKAGTAITEVPVDGMSYKQGDYIGQAQVEMIADSMNILAPHFILANTNYHYAIFSFNGFSGYENYLQSNPLTKSVATPGRTVGNYYNGINPSSPGFVSSLSSKINPHDTIYYSNNIPRYVTPWLARDTSNGQKVVTCVYTNHQYIYTDPFQWANGTNGAVLTREHTWAQSWMPSNVGNPDWPNAIGTSKELPEYNDLFNLFPAHQANANLKRSNNPFDEVLTPTYTSPTGFGMLGKDSLNRTVYEPKPEHKGDVARALFYMAACYNGINGKSWVIPANQNVALLKQWHQMDPPDNFEIAKNEFIAVNQKNRNPFIDHPEWVDRINFSTMTYIPFDTFQPKEPEIQLITPTAADIWGKGMPAKVSWTSKDMDSVLIYFSQDSLKSLQLIATLPASNDSLLFTGTTVYSHPFGIVIIKDKISDAADTSAYYNLNMVNGLQKIDGLSNLCVYPNPGNSKISIYVKGQALKEAMIFDIYGRLIISSDQNEISITELPAGTYFIRVETMDGVLINKFIKE